MADNSFDPEARGMLGIKPKPSPAISNLIFSFLARFSQTLVYAPIPKPVSRHMIHRLSERMGSICRNEGDSRLARILFSCVSCIRSAAQVEQGETFEQIQQRVSCGKRQNISICLPGLEEARCAFRKRGSHGLYSVAPMDDFSPTSLCIASSNIFCEYENPASRLNIARILDFQSYFHKATSL